MSVGTRSLTTSGFSVMSGYLEHGAIEKKVEEVGNGDILSEITYLAGYVRDCSFDLGADIRFDPFQYFFLLMPRTD